MNALLYFYNQQPQAWHESLEMVIRFNIQFSFVIRCNPIPSIEHALDYIYRIHEGIVGNLETKIFGHGWKYKRKLLPHVNAYKWAHSM